MKYIIKRFEELTVDELYESLKLRTKIFCVEQNCVYQDVDGRDKKSYHLMCLDNGRVVGYLRIIDKGITYEEICIGRVVVDTEHRGKDIGSEMLKRAMNFIRNELKENTIRISAQEHLAKFYGDVGFNPVGKNYLEDGIPHIEMFYDASCND
ncbi:MAG: GNAT family N-acetyltransferase [Oscillospiraceae bacterium]|nr:GNAT family N-acetyltransferase [Oscillospiraceae bacterium]